MNKKIITGIVALLITPTIALAGENFAVQVINRLLTMVVWPVFLGLVVIMFIWAGILYLTARGDPEKFKQANLAVLFAIIGIIVAILGYRIVATLRNIIPGSGAGSACTYSLPDCPVGSTCTCPPGSPPCAGNSGTCS